MSSLLSFVVFVVVVVRLFLDCVYSLPCTKQEVIFDHEHVTVPLICVHRRQRERDVREYKHYKCERVMDPKSRS